jgi:hypothetical protein
MARLQISRREVFVLRRTQDETRGGESWADAGHAALLPCEVAPIQNALVDQHHFSPVVFRQIPRGTRRALLPISV